MATIQTAYGTSNQSLTITLTSLASSATAGRESAAVNNSSDLFLDVLVMAKVVLAAGTIANDRAVYVYAYGSVDGGSNYPDNVTGADAAITMTDPTNLRLLGVLNTPTSAGTYKAGPWSLASAFGGVMPERWGVAVRNYSGIALSATASDHWVKWQGIRGTSA